MSDTSNSPETGEDKVSEFVSLSDPSIKGLRDAAINARLTYEKSIIALTEATGVRPDKIERGLVEALMIADLIGMNTHTLPPFGSNNDDSEDISK